MQEYCVIKATSVFGDDVSYVSEIHFDKKRAGPTVVLDPDIKNSIKFFGDDLIHPTLVAANVMYQLSMYDAFDSNTCIGPYKGRYELEVVTLTNMDYVDDAIKQKAIDKANRMAGMAPMAPWFPGTDGRIRRENND